GRHEDGVNISVSGHRFRCKLPQGQGFSTRAAVARRAAALLGTCLGGSAGQEQFELCVSERFSVAGNTAWHDASFDAVHGFGFEQLYTSPELHARLRCTCGSPGDFPREACALGELVWIQQEPEDALAMVVGAGEPLQLRWVQRGQPSNSFPMPRARLRSAEDGRSCISAAQRQPYLVTAEAVAAEGVRHFEVELRSVTCCSTKEEVSQLLEPLRGTCQYAQNGWWTYEICWPFHVRQLHFHTSGTYDADLFHTGVATVAPATRAEVGSVGGVLGFFRSAPQLRRAAARGPLELAVNLAPGDECRVAANHWQIQVQGISSLEVSGVGGHFNPVSLDAVSGHLAAAPNLDLCSPLEQRFEGTVLLALRGNCFFQVKAVNAETAGAVALLVYNDERHAVESMEGVEELVPPRIPTVFIHADKGQELLKLLGSPVQITKVGPPDVDISQPITSSVVFRCNEDFQRPMMCQAGDIVDVKLWVKSTSGGGVSVIPEGATEQELHELASAQAQAMTESASLRLLRAQVLEAFPNESLSVAWLGQQEQDVVLGNVPGINLEEGPVTVPWAAAFRDGVPCTAPRWVWVEKLLEPFACQAEFVVHLASLCAAPRLAPRTREPEKTISCLKEP
ncbi:unnamed protein product, partial [Effrenium voratum]